MEHSTEYLDYLKSEHWAQLRLAAFNRANRKCEACGVFRQDRGMHGHHLVYRRPLTDGVVEDIMALCTSCHDRLHEWLKSTRHNLSQLGREATRGAILVLLTSKNKRRELERAQPKNGSALRGADLQRQLLKDPVFKNALQQLDRGKFKRFLRKFAKRSVFGKKYVMCNGMMLFHDRQRDAANFDAVPQRTVKAGKDWQKL